MNFIRLFATLLALLIVHLASATSIVPFKNLGQYIEHTPYLAWVEVISEFEEYRYGSVHYGYHAKVKEMWKGQADNEVFIKIYQKQVTHQGRTSQVADDLEIIPGTEVIIGLRKLAVNSYESYLMGYYTFEIFFDGHQEILIPSGPTMELSRDNIEKIEPMEWQAFRNQVKSILSGQAKWNMDLIPTHPEILTNFSLRFTQPSHCSNLFGPTLARWSEFSSPSAPTVNIYGDTDGDPTRSNALNLLQNAVGIIQSEYSNTYINVQYAGTADHDPQNCTNYSDVVDNWMATNLGSQNIFVIFDDPCDEMATFDCEGNSIGGTLGLGGCYAGGSHNFDGTNFLNAGTGYVIMNAGLTCVSDNLYTHTLVHELTHTLGIGHISGNCTSNRANMNPGICWNYPEVTSLDQECLTALYFAGALPVTWIDQSGIQWEDQIRIEWSTADEINHDRYLIERWVENNHFEIVADQYVASQQGSIHSYRGVDPSPNWGENIYRIKQIDTDGQVDYSELISVQFRPKETFQVLPNPFQNQLVIRWLSPEKQDSEVKLFTSTGQLLQHQNVTYQIFGEMTMPLHDLSPGAYFIQVVNGNTQWIRKVIKG